MVLMRGQVYRKQEIEANYGATQLPPVPCIDLVDRGYALDEY